MAITNQLVDPNFSGPDQARLTEFHIDGLFGGVPIHLTFPGASESGAEPTLLILSGQNGSGKTTIFRMIEGMLRLDFDTFRQVPFRNCSLSLSTGDKLSVKWIEDPRFPLRVGFRDLTITLGANRQAARYEPNHELKVDAFRRLALPVLRTVSFTMLSVDRSASKISEAEIPVDLVRGKKNPRTKTLAEQVQTFLNVAQIDYKGFFRDEELGVIPRLLDRLRGDTSPPAQEELLARISRIQDKHALMRRYGLHFDEDIIRAIAGLIENPEYNAPTQLGVLEAYVDMQEGAQQAKDLIAKRLVEFDAIMSDFLTGKTIRIDSSEGLSIRTNSGSTLKEEDLSSGEYHFLYMMVTALLCKRTGSVIAIDEPELSLHIRWQRKLVSALARCAAGASPLFLFATHSIAISAEHADRVIALSSVE